MSAPNPILLNGQWIPGEPSGSFHAANPSLGVSLDATYPISFAADVQAMLTAGSAAADALWSTPPATIAAFLRTFADAIERDRIALVELAHQETGYPKEPRLNSVELPRTTNQLRQAAAAVEDGAWAQPVIDAAANIRSIYGPLGGPVVVMGPNNFPFAFNSIAGGDFAAAIAARNPVIAVANPAHPATTQKLAELAQEAVIATGLHPATVQLLYRVPPEIGFQLVTDKLVGATAFTGSKPSGLRLKEAADRAGKPIYLEMSSVNPVVILPGVLADGVDAMAAEFAGSCLLGAGQFCTNPGLVIVQASPQAEFFIQAVAGKFASAPAGTLLSQRGLDTVASGVEHLTQHGATALTGAKAAEGPAFRFENTLLTVDGNTFLAAPDELQAEAFGPVSLVVTVQDIAQMKQVLASLEGNLTGTIYSARAVGDTPGSDDAAYAELEPILRRKVGRLINDKMPTGVAVSPAMNHGGPYPATGHPGFTSVGIPASIRRFAALHCYDGCRQDRLPAALQDPA